MKDQLWWVLPGQLAGMPMPFLDPNRRAVGASAIDDFDDDLQPLYDAGIRAVVSLLGISADAPIYPAAGFSYLAFAIPDGGTPTIAEADRINHFIDEQLMDRKPVAVHCAAGLGRTGTVLAAYLIRLGATADEAIQKIRAVEQAAIETHRQERFLREFEIHGRMSEP